MAWRRPSSWRWPLVLAALLVVVAGVAAGVGLSALTADPPLTVSIAPTAPAAPPPGQLAEGGSGEEADVGAGEEIAGWPRDERGYTVVLAVRPDENAARAEAARAQERGIEEVGVLSGREHSGLDPNQFVVFAGRYDKADDARQDADDYAGQGYGDAFPRLIEPAR
jgi:hypothetical protein